MPEAVIVATARTPIGRANKGSLVDCRPDDLSALDHPLPCSTRCRSSIPRRSRTSSGAAASPPAKRASTSRRVAALLAGVDVPGVTVNRYCSSSLQTIRMAAHAIKAGEGDVFVAGGVETVSRFMQRHGRQRSARTRSSATRVPARSSGPKAVSRRGRRRPASPTSTSRWARPRRTCVEAEGVTREEMDEFARPVAAARGRGAGERLLRARDHAGHAAPTARS